MRSQEQNQQQLLIKNQVPSEDFNENYTIQPRQPPHQQQITYSQLSQYTIPQVSQQPPFEPAKLLPNTPENNQTNSPENKIFVPVVYSPPVQHLNQIQPYQINNTEQPIMNSEQNQIKDLPYSEIKSSLIYIILLFLAESVIEFFLIFLIAGLTQNVIEYTAPVVFPATLVALYILAKVGISEKARKVLQFFIQTPQAIVVFLGLTYLTAQTLVSFSFLFDNTRPHNDGPFNFSVADIVMTITVIQMFVNVIVSLLIIFCVSMGKDKILITPALIVIGVVSIISLCASIVFIFNCALTLIFTMIMFNSLNQIQKGRFELKKDDVIFAQANAAYFGFLFPFDI